MVSIKFALIEGAKRLQNIAERARYEAEILMSFFAGLSRVELITKEDRLIDENGFFALIAKRETGYPIEYITKSAGFYSRDFFCEEGVLIPRPETELLVDRVVELASDFGDGNLTIAEIGVGGGAIAVTLAILLKNISIVATDINKKAIEIAKINADRYGVKDRIEFINTNLLDGVNKNIDILVSNPPYIEQGYDLPKNVSYEPENALFGGEGGIDILKEIIELKQAVIACECGYNQEGVLRSILVENGYKQIAFYKDYANLTRGFTAR
ncbi:N5-glutamine S-adenosyl-L-methionine-dependent methyltransferase [Campylobacterota bacterium]|nr:N5-glutamine S-adenosyl-L-methionine-dependent methyltransferase [Campylobacterota bacterium]